MAGPTTISEALLNLPSSSRSFTSSSSSGQPLSNGRRLLVTKKKFTSSASAETHKPAKLQWVKEQTHIRTDRGVSSSGIKRDGKVKEAILISGRDGGVKQGLDETLMWRDSGFAIALKFNCSLPLPFLEQNGIHDEDLGMDIDNDEVEESAGGGMGLTASDLDMDMGEDDEISQNWQPREGGLTADDLLEGFEEEAPKPSTSNPKQKHKPTSHIPKRRRIDADLDDITASDILPADFLELLKSELPRKKNASPGDFARVWKMSGRRMGNDMVSAQNEYFSLVEGVKKPDMKKKGKVKGKY
ncbi:hypothetical protein ABW19_dt0203633 [Dactylella cylindrospora]|nr:hypothetical protein ABW19_dt0203633 [Dactylella cylindrospora]